MLFTNFPFETGDGRNIPFNSDYSTYTVASTITFRHLRLVIKPLADTAKMVITQGNLEFVIVPFFDTAIGAQIVFFYVYSGDFSTTITFNPTSIEYYYQYTST